MKEKTWTCQNALIATVSAIVEDKRSRSNGLQNLNQVCHPEHYKENNVTLNLFQGLSIGLPQFKLGKNQTDRFRTKFGMTNDKKRCAFTLVEIMIAIGIIGIVAAITIPTMIQNSNSKKFATQLKKSISTLNQASIGAQAQYDVNYSMMSTESADATCGSDSLAKGDMTFCSLLNTTLAGQTYLGTYGQKVKSASGFGLYSMDAKKRMKQN